jgi:hypothetical protein
MLTGAHSIVYSKDPEADRGFLRDVLRLPHVDVGDGWLVFGLPPAEVAVHPSEKNDIHELYLICKDIDSFVAKMESHCIECAPVRNQGWGLLTQVTLPGGGKLGVYEPRHSPGRGTQVQPGSGRRCAVGRADSGRALPRDAGSHACFSVGEEQSGQASGGQA